MAWRIEQIEIENLKFYRKSFKLKLNGQNALIFGENGAGKSSIYWSVYTHFQAAFKEAIHGQKYFLPTHPENLRNRFSDHADYSGIKVSFTDGLGNIDTYEDSNLNFFPSNPDKRRFIELTARTSDFLNYKLVSSIFDFKNSEDNDIFNILEKEIFPVLDLPSDLKNFDNESTGITNISGWWKWLNSFDSILPHNIMKPKTFNLSHPKYKTYEKRLDTFNSQLSMVLRLILSRANAIIKDNFHIPVRLDMDYSNATFNDLVEGRTKTRTGKLLPPQIILKAIYEAEGVVDRSEVRHPKSFFNEAKLACMGIAFRFAVIEQRTPVDAGAGVLLLDDVMHSLDMGVRRIVIPILLDYQKQWQMIVMTHDRALFNLFRQEQNRRNHKIDWTNEERVGTGEDMLPKEKWKVFELFAIEKDGSCPEPYLVEKPSLIQLANIHLKQCQIAECANTLRRYCERELKRILPINHILDSSEFGEKMLNGLIQSFENFLVKECKMNVLKDISLHMDGDRRLILNPFSHADITTPFYREELKALIKYLPELEKIQVKEVVATNNDIRNTVFKISISKEDNGEITQGWVKFKFLELFYEVKYEGQSYFSSPKIEVVAASDVKISKHFKTNGNTLRFVYQRLHQFVQPARRQYGAAIISKE